MTSALSRVEVTASCVLHSDLKTTWSFVREWGPALWMQRADSPTFRILPLNGSSATEVGSTRMFMVGSSQMFEQLTALDDQEQSLRWKLISHPQTVSPFQQASFVNYTSTLRLAAVTVGNLTFAEWKGQFFTEPQNVQHMQSTLESWYLTGFQNLQDFALGQLAPRSVLPGRSSTGTRFQHEDPTNSFAGSHFYGPAKGVHPSGGVPRSTIGTASNRFVGSMQHIKGHPQSMDTQAALAADRGSMGSSSQAWHAAKAALGTHRLTEQNLASRRQVLQSMPRNSDCGESLSQYMQPQGPGPPIGALSGFSSDKMSYGSLPTSSQALASSRVSSQTGNESRSTSWGTEKAESQDNLSQPGAQAAADCLTAEKSDDKSSSGSRGMSSSQMMDSSQLEAQEMDDSRNASTDSENNSTSQAALPQSFGSFARLSFEKAKRASADLGPADQPTAAAKFMSSLAERLEANQKGGARPRRSSFEEEAIQLQERHNALHRNRLQNAKTQGVFVSPFGAVNSSPFGAQSSFAVQPESDISNSSGSEGQPSQQMPVRAAGMHRQMRTCGVNPPDQTKLSPFAAGHKQHAAPSSSSEMDNDHFSTMQA